MNWIYKLCLNEFVTGSEHRSRICGHLKLITNIGRKFKVLLISNNSILIQILVVKSVYIRNNKLHKYNLNMYSIVLHMILYSSTLLSICSTSIC